MCIPEGLGRIELDLGGDADERGEVDVLRITGGTIDVKDCFYRLRIRRSLAEYFAFPPVRADSPGRRSRTGWIWPCLRLLVAAGEEDQRGGGGQGADAWRLGSLF